MAAALRTRASRWPPDSQANPLPPIFPSLAQLDAKTATKLRRANASPNPKSRTPENKATISPSRESTVQTRPLCGAELSNKPEEQESSELVPTDRPPHAVTSCQGPISLLAAAYPPFTLTRHYLSISPSDFRVSALQPWSSTGRAAVRHRGTSDCQSRPRLSSAARDCGLHSLICPPSHSGLVWASHFPSKEKQEVLEVAVVWRGADQASAGLKGTEAPFGPFARCIKVFDHFGADHEIERRFLKPIQN